MRSRALIQAFMLALYLITTASHKGKSAKVKMYLLPSFPTFVGPTKELRGGRIDSQVGYTASCTLE